MKKEKMKKYYDTLTFEQKQELLKQYKQNISSLEKRLKEKNELIYLLNKSIEKEDLIKTIDELTKDKKTEKKEVPVDKPIITVIVNQGIVDNIEGLPEGYDWDIKDYDNKGICKICGETVIEFDWLKHLCKHNPNAEKLDWKQLDSFFDEVF